MSEMTGPFFVDDDGKPGMRVERIRPADDATLEADAWLRWLALFRGVHYDSYRPPGMGQG